MADYKVVDATQLDEDLKGICDTIRNYPNSGYTNQDLFSFPNGIKQAIPTAMMNVGDTSYSNGYSEGFSFGFNDGKSTASETLYSIVGRTGTELNIDASTFGNGAFYNWTTLEKARLPLGQLFVAYSFRACSGLKILDVGDATRTDLYVNSNSLYFRTNSFNSASSLKYIVLRPNIVAGLQSTSAFSDCPLTQGTGKILAPAAFVNSYQNATNWSAMQSPFCALEDYTIDGTLTGAINWDALLAV